MLIRLLTFLGVWRGVWLEDHQSQIYATRARKSPFGGCWAHVYNFTHTGHVRLLPNGTIPDHYCKRWIPMRPEQFTPEEFKRSEVDELERMMRP